MFKNRIKLMTENNNIVIYQSEDGKVQLNKEAKNKSK